MSPFKKAERKRAKLRLGICGPSGAGKTYSALKIAFGLGGRIALVDTENGSGELYSDMGNYDVAPLLKPYTPERYIDLIHQAEKDKYDVIILDSITHAWAGEGGLLDEHGRITAASRSKNSYTAWRDITPKHNAFIEAMLSSPCHLIATMRSKVDHVVEKDGDKTIIKKVGMAPIQREGMDYEFTTVFDLTIERHLATVSKDRTGLFDGKPPFTPTTDTGATLINWLDSGVDMSGQLREECDEAKRLCNECPDMGDLQKHYDSFDDISKSWGEPYRGEWLAEVKSKKLELNATPKERAA